MQTPSVHALDWPMGRLLTLKGNRQLLSPLDIRFDEACTTMVVIRKAQQAFSVLAS